MLCGAMHEHRIDVYKLDERGVPTPTAQSLSCPVPTHSLWLDPAQRLRAMAATTCTTVTHPDGTKVEVKTTGASL
jgi:hypothetical protein